MTKETKLLKNTGIIAIGNIGTKCVSFLFLPLYTSILSTEEYGVFDLISTYVTLLTVIFTLQFEQGIFRFLIESRNNVERRKKYITTALGAVVLINFIVLVVLVLILNAISYKYTLYLVTWTALNTFSTMLLQIPRGMGDNITFVTGGFISGVSYVILNVIFVAIMRMGIEGMLMANIIACGISILFISLRTRLWAFISVKNLDKNSLVALLKYSLPLIPYTLCWWIISASDRQIITIFLGKDANGIYSLAYKFPSIFAMITSIFQTAWAESAAENFEMENDSNYYNSMINKAVRFYSSGNMFIIAAIPLLFSFLIRKDFVNAYNYIPILMMGALLQSVSALYGSIYLAYKKTKEVSWTAYVSAIINVLINLLFINDWGLYAAAISTLIAYIVAIIIRQIDIQKYVHIKINLKYLFIELFVYFIVLYSYYLKKTIIQIIVVALLIPYFVYQNKDTVNTIIKLIQKRLSRR